MVNFLQIPSIPFHLIVTPGWIDEGLRMVPPMAPQIGDHFMAPQIEDHSMDSQTEAPFLMDPQTGGLPMALGPFMAPKTWGLRMDPQINLEDHHLMAPLIPCYTGCDHMVPWMDHHLSLIHI